MNLFIVEMVCKRAKHTQDDDLMSVDTCALILDFRFQSSDKTISNILFESTMGSIRTSGWVGG